MGVRWNLAVVGFERPVTAVAAVELPPYEMHDPVFCLFFFYWVVVLLLSCGKF